jgi:hypothetical protein
VKANRNIVVLGIALITILSSTVNSASFFTDQGSIWTGGSFSYANENIRGVKEPYNILMLSPTFNFFPAKYFLVGPAVSWTLISQKNTYGSGNFSVGPLLGFAYGNNIPVVPYVISGLEYMHSYYSSTYADETHKSGADGYQIPINAGLMIPLVDGVGIQVQAGFLYYHTRNYTYADKQDLSMISFSIGVCGIGKKTAISLLNSFGGLFY